MINKSEAKPYREYRKYTTKADHLLCVTYFVVPYFWYVAMKRETDVFSINIIFQVE